MVADTTRNKDLIVELGESFVVVEEPSNPIPATAALFVYERCTDDEDDSCSAPGNSPKND